jgi:hypothetical protein
MQTRQGNVLQSLRNVQSFLHDNAAVLDAVIHTGARRRLDDAITQLAAHASAQDANDIASQGSTRQQRALRTVLQRDHMSPIARIAKVDLSDTPAIEPLRMPKGRPSTERLASAAYGMAKAATPFAPVFVAAGLPSDFVARLKGASDDMISAVSERAQTRGKRSGATRGLAHKLTEGRKVVHILDAFVKTALKRDGPLLASWERVKRVNRIGTRTISTTS